MDRPQIARRRCPWRPPRAEVEPVVRVRRWWDHRAVTDSEPTDPADRLPRHKVMLRVPRNVEHPENVDLARAIEILNSPTLGEEIWAANNYNPDLEA